MKENKVYLHLRGCIQDWTTIQRLARLSACNAKVVKWGCGKRGHLTCVKTSNGILTVSFQPQEPMHRPDCDVSFGCWMLLAVFIRFLF